MKMKKKDEELSKKITDTTDFALRNMLKNPSDFKDLIFGKELEGLKAELSDEEIEDAENCVDENFDVNLAEKSKECLAYMELYGVVQNTVNCAYNAVSSVLRKNKIEAMKIVKKANKGKYTDNGLGEGYHNPLW